MEKFTEKLKGVYNAVFSIQTARILVMIFGFICNTVMRAVYLFIGMVLSGMRASRRRD